MSNVPAAQPEFTAVEFEGGAHRYVALSIIRADEASLPHFKSIWHEMSKVVTNFHEICDDKDGCPSWASWQVYKWSKEYVADRERFVAWNGKVLAGFLNLIFVYKSQYEQGRKITYIEHLAAAPGNQTTRIWKRSLGRIGPALMAFAVQQSVMQGYGGLVGLHVADDDVLGWYQALDKRFKLFRPVKTSVPGFYERQFSRPYYETTMPGAQALLESYRND